MLTIYWLCLAIGGVFVLLAMLGGLDGVDFDHDVDFDAHLDSDIDPDLELVDPGDRAPDNPFRPRPRRLSPIGIVKSLKFWTFGVCFFGLTGLVLSSLPTVLPSLGIAIAAISMGILCGAIISGTLRALRHQQADSLIRSEDLVGITGTVEVPFNPSSRGKVRLQVKGSTLEMIAYTEDAREFSPGDRVLVVGTEQNRLWVISTDSLSSSSPPPEAVEAEPRNQHSQAEPGNE